MLCDIKFSKDTKVFSSKPQIYEHQKTPAGKTESLGEQRKFQWYHFY